MPETLLIIAPKSATALIALLLRRLEPRLGGAWTVEHHTLGVLVEERQNKGDTERLRRRLRRKDRPLPLVIQTEQGLTDFRLLGAPPTVPTPLDRAYRDAGIPFSLFELLTLDRPDQPSVYMNISPSGVKVSGVAYDEDFPHHPPLVNDGAWEHAVMSLAESIERARVG